MVWLLGVALAAPMFEDITEAVGLDASGPSFGMALADVDGDGLIDLYLTNHAQMPTLFLQRDGRFVRSPGPRNRLDAHGVAIVDLDHDGRRDIFEAHGAQRAKGAVANRAWMNTPEGFEDRGKALGLGHAQASARMPLPLDADGDGWLDLFVAAGNRKDNAASSALFFGGEDGWSAPLEIPRTAKGGVTFVGDTRGDARPEIHLVADGTLRVLTASRDGWEETTLELPRSTLKVGSVVPGDLNGDGHLDFITLPAPSGTDVWQGTNEVRVSHMGTLAKGLRVRFKGHALTVDVGPRHGFAAERVVVGKNCTPLEALPAVLKPKEALGVCTDPGDRVRIARVRDEWITQWSSESWEKVHLTLSAPRMSDVAFVGLPVEQSAKRRQKLTATVLLGSPDGFVPAPDTLGLPTLNDCATGVLFDADADGDLDLYAGCGTTAANTPNRLFLNQGGRFSEVLEHGAEGTDLGMIDRIGVGDHDQDGRPELVVLNGEGGSPWAVGPVQLMESTAAPSLRLVVQGGPHNADAYGAKVAVDFGKGRVVHRQVGLGSWCAQHDLTLLIGTAGAKKAKKATVTWPDGRQRVFKNLKADRTHVLAPR